jgi:hypothetical protein
VSPNVPLVLGVVFLSTFVRSALGFGDALIAMPLLALIVGMHTATPLVALVASTIAFIILVKAWRQVDVAAAWRLVISTVVGVPIGIFFLNEASESVVEAVLGIVLIGFGLYNLVVPRLPKLGSERLSYAFGLVAGILGGAYNTNGPPVVIYGVLRDWEPERFRATLQGYFLPTGGIILAFHGLTGMWTPEVLQLYLYCLPVVIGAVLVGGWVNQRISGDRFNQVIYALLVLVGALLFV